MKYYSWLWKKQNRLKTLLLKDSRQFAGSYHNHTTWSDGTLSPREILDRALKYGFSEVGITDHYFTLKGEIHCVTDDRIDDYIEMINKLRSEYINRLTILVGLEIDASKSNPKRFDLPIYKLNKLDYVLFEYVDEHDDYTLLDLIKIRRKLSCGVGLAHPDLKNLVSKYGSEELAKTLGENNIFIDACGSARNSRWEQYNKDGIKREFTLNIEGLGGEFKEAARKYNVRFAPSSDTHHDNPHDRLEDAKNASGTMVRYKFSKQEFRSQKQKN